MTNRDVLNKRFIQVFTMLTDRGFIVKNGRGDKSKSAFAEKIGTKGHIVDLYLRGTRNITYEQTKRMCEEYGVNEQYMFQGVGSPFQSGEASNANYTPNPGGSGNIMFSNMSAFASSAQDSQIREEAEYFNIPGVHGECVAFYIKGNSMSPTINDGDMVICKPIEDAARIRNNHIYAIVSQGAVMVKRLQKIHNPSSGRFTHLKLISDNFMEHDPFFLEVNEISKVLEVTKRITAL